MASRVTIVSTASEGALAMSLSRGAVEAGWEVSIATEPQPLPRQAAPIALRMAQRWPTALLSRGRLLASVKASRPNLIVVMKGTYVPGRLITRLNEFAPTVCWNADSPFDSAASNSGGYVLSAIPRYSAYVTWSESLAASLHDLRDNVFRIPFAYDPVLHPRGEPDAAFAERVVLLGSYSPERHRLLREISQYSPLAIGGGWKSSGIDNLPPAVGSRFASIALGARWCLNPLRPQNRDSHNMRSFELLGLGAAQLTYDTSDHRHFLAGSRSTLVNSVEEIRLALENDPPPSAVEQLDLTNLTYAARWVELLRHLEMSGLLP